MPTRYVEVCSKKTHRKHYVLLYQPVRTSASAADSSNGEVPHRVHLDDGRPLRWTQDHCCFQELRTDEEFTPVAKDLEALRRLG